MSTEQAPQLRDPSGLWPWFRGFIILYLVLAIMQYALSTSFFLLSGASPDYAPADATGMSVTLGFVGVSALLTIAFILCIVFTGRLTYRLMRNLHQIQSNYVTTSPGWAVGWYFIPFANLVMPVQAVTQIWRGTFAATEGEPPPDPNGAIAAWWGCWLIGNISDSVGERLIGAGLLQEPTTPSTEMLYAALGLFGFGALMSVLACIFMLRLFGKLTRAQSQMVRAAAF